MLRESGKPAEALKSLESARKVRQKLAEDNPSVTWYQEELAQPQQHRRLPARDRQASRGAEIVRVGAADLAEAGAGPSRVAYFPEQLRLDIEQFRDDRTGGKTV